MDLSQVIGLGVAGNFAGHLEQAGEAGDFVHVQVDDATAPKGLFPFYLPGATGDFLSVQPISSEWIALAAPGESLQSEPEVALLCDLEVESKDDGDRIIGVVPRSFAAHNDCSIRREGASKISEKKNWGPCSKGTSSDMIKIDHFGSGGILDRFRIGSYLVRAGRVEAYGQDSAVSSYTYFHERLLDWFVDKLQNQIDEGPLENVGDCWRRAGRPSQALVSIGATRYTDFGESTFLEEADRAIVVVYDGDRCDSSQIEERIERGTLKSSEGCSVLDQTVVRAAA